MSGATPALDEAAVRDARARLLARIDGTADLIRPAFPHAADGDTGRWQAKPGGAWTDGFWVGLCWLAYRLTGADRYRAWGLAGRMLAGLVARFLTPLGPGDPRPPGMQTHTCYNLHTGEAPDHELIWGDYFLLEALRRWPASDR